MTLSPEAIKELQDKARRIRRLSLEMIYLAESGHPGGSLSAAEIMACLFFQEMRLDPARPDWPERDRFVLSKGHACPALYAAAAERGIIPEGELAGFRKLGRPLHGHPSAHDLPWVEASTGSLGQGFSAAMGMALGLRHQNNPARVYVLLGDGELQEGEVWEAAMFAGHHRLSNLTAIIDYNKMQSDDLNENICGLEPLADKWRAFNWRVEEVDGHDVTALGEAFGQAREHESGPTIIIAHTEKGRGVSYMAGSPLWHGSLKLSETDLVTSLSELNAPNEEVSRCLDGSIWQDHRG